MKNKLLMTLLLALGLGLTACNNKKDDAGSPVGSVAGGGRGALNSDTSLLGGSAMCGMGKLVLKSQQALVDFLEGSYDTKFLGNVDLNTGVDIWSRTYIRKVDGVAMPDFNGAKSFLEFNIADSYNTSGGVSTKITFRIPLDLDRSGESNAFNGIAKVYYKDEFSKVVLNANFNFDQTSGTISFLNLKTNKNDSLGSFSIRTCALFVEPK